MEEDEGQPLLGIGDRLPATHLATSARILVATTKKLFNGFIGRLKRSYDIQAFDAVCEKIGACSLEALLLPQNARLQFIVDQLVAAGAGLCFASICLVEHHRGTFCMYAKAGVGEEFFPPLVKAVQHQDQNGFEAVQNMEETEEGGRSMGSTSSSKAASHADSTKSQLESNFTLFPRAGVVYGVRNSNWSIDDVVSSGTPWMYDCTPSRSTGLPKEAMWLKRAGAKCMISLPCTHEGSVRGVLTVGLSRLSSLEHTWLLPLQQLAYKITPFVVEACAEQIALLATGRLQRFRSTNDIAASMLDELCVLDKILLAGLVNSPRHPYTGAGGHTSAAARSAAHAAYAQDGSSNSGAAASKAVAATGLSLALEALGQDGGMLGPLGPGDGRLMPWPTPVLWPKAEPAPAPAAPTAAAAGGMGRWAAINNGAPAGAYHPRLLADTGSSQQPHQVGGLTPQSVRRAANAAAAAARSALSAATATLLPQGLASGSGVASAISTPEPDKLRSLQHLPVTPIQQIRHGDVLVDANGNPMMLDPKQLHHLPIPSPVTTPSPASGFAQEPSGVVGPPAYPTIAGEVPWHVDVDAEEALASAARLGSMTERLQGSVAYQEAVASLLLQGGLMSDTSSGKSTGARAQPVCVISAGDDVLDTSQQHHAHAHQQHLASMLPWPIQGTSSGHMSQRASYEQQGGGGGGPGSMPHSTGGGGPGMLQGCGQEVRLSIGSPEGTPGMHLPFNSHQQHMARLAAHGSAPITSASWQPTHTHMHSAGAGRYQHMHQLSGQSSHCSSQGISGTGAGISDRHAQRSCPSAWDQHTTAMVQQAQRSAHHAAMYFHSQPMHLVPGAPFLYAAQQPMQQSCRMEDVLSEVGYMTEQQGTSGQHSANQSMHGGSQQHQHPVGQQLPHWRVQGRSSIGALHGAYLSGGGHSGGAPGYGHTSSFHRVSCGGASYTTSGAATPTRHAYGTSPFAVGSSMNSVAALRHQFNLTSGVINTLLMDRASNDSSASNTNRSARMSMSLPRGQGGSNTPSRYSLEESGAAYRSSGGRRCGATGGGAGSGYDSSGVHRQHSQSGVTVLSGAAAAQVLSTLVPPSPAGAPSQQAPHSHPSSYTFASSDITAPHSPAPTSASTHTSASSSSMSQAHHSYGPPSHQLVSHGSIGHGHHLASVPENDAASAVAGDDGHAFGMPRSWLFKPSGGQVPNLGQGNGYGPGSDGHGGSGSRQRHPQGNWAM